MNLSHISPGLVGMYWLLASFGAATLWVGACEITRRVARARCTCWDCER